MYALTAKGRKQNALSGSSILRRAEQASWKKLKRFEHRNLSCFLIKRWNTCFAKRSLGQRILKEEKKMKYCIGFLLLFAIFSLKRLAGYVVIISRDENKQVYSSDQRKT